MSAKILLSAIVAIGLFSSCSKDSDTTPDPNPNPEPKGTVAMKFENYAGNDKLSLKNGATYNYANSNGDEFNVTTYKYYVSNVRFVNSNGSEYAEPESYHLINQAEDASLTFNIASLPAGTYTSVKVLLGVDSLRNVSGAQTGALDPMYGMFWTWSSGYIIAKVEGGFKHGTTGTNTGFSFHLGGFSGQYSVLHEVTLPLPQNLVVGTGTTSTITFKSDVLKWFGTPNLIKFDDLSQVGALGADAHKISQNYAQSLSVTAVQN